MLQHLQERKLVAVGQHLTPKATVHQCLLLLVCCQHYAVDHQVLPMYVLFRCIVCFFFALTFDMGYLVGNNGHYWKNLNNH